MSKEQPNYEIPYWMQEALGHVNEKEKLGFNCEAMREHIYKLEAMGFDPDKHVLVEGEDGELEMREFHPEKIVEGLPEVVVFEN